jgi:hypothetical protein
MVLVEGAVMVLGAVRWGAPTGMVGCALPAPAATSCHHFLFSELQ